MAEALNAERSRTVVAIPSRPRVRPVPADPLATVQRRAIAIVNDRPLTTVLTALLAGYLVSRLARRL